MINVMYLKNPKTIPLTPVHGKIVFHKTGPHCQKGWGLLVETNLELTSVIIYQVFIRCSIHAQPQGRDKEYKT